MWLIAQQMLFRHTLSAGDAIHLAAALAVQSNAPGLVFWTADRRQADAGTAEGLQVELLD